nr:MAG TPA_asm: hypothetical protein [Bacteriophage sp.]
MYSNLFLEITAIAHSCFSYMAQRSALSNAKDREVYNREM